MPLLPVDRSANDTRGRKKLSGQSISGGDAPVINPGVGRTSQLKAPAGAFDSGLSQVTQETAPLMADTASRLKVAEVKQQSRTDTIARASAINKYQEGTALELQRMNDEEDFSDEEVAAKYGAFVSEQQKALLEAHEGSEDSKASLTVRLGQIQSESIMKASTLQTMAGKASAKKMYDSGLAPLSLSVSKDPSARNIDAQLFAAETLVQDTAGAFDPEQEESLRREAREDIALTAFNTLVDAGKYEQAEALMENSTIMNALSPETRRGSTEKLRSSQKSKSGLLAKFHQAEQIIGKPLTEYQKLKLIGIAPTGGAPTKFDKIVENLEAQGHSTDDAFAIAGGNVKVSAKDEEGNYWALNTTNNTKKLITEEKAKGINKAMGVEPAPEAEAKVPEPASLSLRDATKQGVGPAAGLGAAYDKYLGFLGGPNVSETTDSKQKIRVFSQTAKSALVNNPKFPVAEQAIVAKLLPDADTFFQNPETALRNVEMLDTELERMQNSKQKERDSGKNLSSERRSDLADQISRIQEIRTLMENPEAAPLPEGIEKGSKLIGKSKGGYDVYQDAQGNQFEYTPEEKAPAKKKVTSKYVKNPTDDMGFGKRHQKDQGDKGIGFIKGKHFDKNDDRMTEVTIGIQIDGKEVDVPLINGLTTKADMKVIASGKIDPVIDAKAEKWALSRIAEGKSIFLEKGEKQLPFAKEKSSKSRNQETPDSQDLERIVQLFDELESNPSDKKKKKQVVKLLTALEKKLGIKIDENFIKTARK